MKWRINTPLLGSLLRQKVLRNTMSFQEASTRQWTLCPAETQTVKPAFFLESSLERITGVGLDTTLDGELSRIRGGKITHGATIAYLLKSVRLIDGVLYGQGMSQRLVKQPKRLLIDDTVASVRNGAVACTYYGSIFFGHWMKDDLTLQLATADMGESFIAERSPYRHESGYRDLFDIQGTSLREVEFDELIMLDDRGQNRYKRQRYELMRQRLRHCTALGNEKVYIRRGVAGARMQRKLAYSDELEAALKQWGFAIVDPDQMSPREIVEACLGARVIVGVEGSHMAPAIFTLADGGALCILQPPYRFNNVYKNYADCLGFDYAFVIGEMGEDGFHIHLDELQCLLDRLMQEI